MTETRDEKTEICKTLSPVCHIENFKVRLADDLDEECSVIRPMRMAFVPVIERPMPPFRICGADAACAVFKICHSFAHPTCILYFIANSSLFSLIYMGIFEVYMTCLILKKE